MPRFCQNPSGPVRSVASTDLNDDSPRSPASGLTRLFTMDQATLSRRSTMTRFWQHFISNGYGPPSAGSPPEPSPEENDALDAYSRVVVRVADALRPAIVNLRAGRGNS